MAGMSHYMEKKVLDYLFGNTTPTSIGTHYYALLKVAPTESGPVGGSEVTGGSYARVAVTNDASNYPAVTLGNSEKNLNFTGGGVSFPEATANWGTITHIAIMDASSAGNMLFAVPLSSPQTINSGDVFRIPNGTAGARFLLT